MALSLEPYINYICCTVYKDRSKIENILKDIDITEVQKEMIRLRYIYILENFQKRVRNHSIMFFIGHFIITVGSLFVPALLSIQNSNTNFTFSGSNFTVTVYWATFIISLLVTVCNGILALYKIDKKYYFLNTGLERLRSEGWQYLGLTGRYSGHLIGNQHPTHQNQFIYFIHYIEKFKMKQVEEEYYKTDGDQTHAPNSKNTMATPASGSELYPPSPDQPFHTMERNVPDPVKEAVNSLIKSQKTVEPLLQQVSQQVTQASQVIEENVIVIPNHEIPLFKDTIDPL